MDASPETLKALYKTESRRHDGVDLDRIEQTFRRKGLDLRKRFLCAVSALTTLDRPEYLRFFLRWAIYENVDPVELYEVVLQSYLFAGYPAAIEGCFALRDVLQDSDLSLESGEPDYLVDEWRERGQELCQRIYGEQFDRLQENIGTISPELGEWMIVEGYGKVLSRPQLGPVERELCTVAALTVSGRKRQLRSHIKGALNVGSRFREVRETILQTALFVDSMSILDALEVLQACEQS